MVTDKVCEKHGMFHIRIINKGKRPWDLGCPHCNFLDWQAKKALELAEGKESGEGKGAKARPAKKTVRGSGAKAAKKASGPSNADGDGLARLPGIGPKTLEKLASAGIKTSGELAGANARSLAAKSNYDSPAARQYRAGSAACRNCRLRRHCGGCLAVAHGQGLDPLGDRDPFCFIDGVDDSASGLSFAQSDWSVILGE